MLFVWYPKCSTSLKAKKWLDAHNIPYEERNIKEDNPTAAELKQWHEKSGLPLKKFFNTSGQLYREMKLSEKLPQMPEEEQIALLASDGMLVKRPVLVAEDLVLTGFREAEYEKLLKQAENLL
ncbi:MAG: arsenate reductase family protein [Solobacterium sp.]|nr:arsenate reductase family protein [Solobacterium sp.]